MANILIVEDDIDIARGIGEFLATKDHTLDFAYNGQQALDLIEHHSYQLVLLDINLPLVNGFNVCRSLLTEKLATIPVIIMSARGTEQDILKGFAAGAWDYLVKPFSLAELSARITANLAKNTQPTSKVIRYQDISLDTNTMTLNYQGQSLQLHKSGFDILRLLLRNAPQLVKTSQLQQQLWGEDTPNSDPLRAHVYKLRQQLKQHFGQTFITTIKGAGYQFDIQA